MKIEYISAFIIFVSLFAIGAMFISSRSTVDSVYNIHQGKQFFKTDCIIYDADNVTIRFYDKMTDKDVILRGTYSIYENKTERRH